MYPANSGPTNERRLKPVAPFFAKVLAAAPLRLLIASVLTTSLLGGCSDGSDDSDGSNSSTSELTSPPQGVSTTNGASSVTLGWSPVKDAKKYNVHQCDFDSQARQCAPASEQSCEEFLGDTDSDSFTVEGIEPGEVSCFAVKACNDLGCTPHSETALGHLAVDPQASVLVSGAEQVEEGQQVTLHSKVANTVGTVNYQWEQTAGTTVALRNAQGAELEFTAPAVSDAEILQFTLTVTDDQGSVTTNVEVLVNPDHVFANAGKDKYVQPGQVVSLHSTGRGDGSLATFAWTQLSGHSVMLDNTATSNPVFTAPSLRSGTDLVFELTFSDGIDSAKDRVIIHVLPTNTSASGHTPLTSPGTQVTTPLLVSTPPVIHVPAGSTPNLPTVIQGGTGAHTQNWQVTSTTPIDAPRPTIVGGTNPDQIARLVVPAVTVPTTYALAVTVTDNNGSGTSTGATASVVAYPDAVPAILPLSIHAPSLTADEGPRPVSLSARASGGMEPYQYQWSQLTGPAVTLTDADQSISFFKAPAVTGNTELQFKVVTTDAQQQMAEQSVKVLIRDSFALVPQQVLRVQTRPPLPALSGSSINLVANAQGGDGNYTWQWSQTAGKPAVITDGNSDAPTVSLPRIAGQSEVLEFTVTVSDNSGHSSDGVVIVNLQPEATQAPNPLSVAAALDFSVPEKQSAIPLAIPVHGGSPPYSYRWQQVSGVPVTLANANQAVALLDAPEVTGNNRLSFKVEVSDMAGSSVEQRVNVTIQDIVAPLPGVVVQVDPTLSVLAGNTIDVTATATGGSGHYSLQWQQVDGPGAQLTGADQATVTVVTPRVTTADKLELEVTVTDTDTGQTVTRPLAINLHPDASTIPLALQPMPTLYVDEGQTDIKMHAVARGGSGQYQYQWLPSPAPLAIPVSNATDAVASFDAPGVDHTYPVTFELTVSDGTSSITGQQAVVINDLAGTLQLSGLSPQQVHSGDRVYLNGAPAHGGVGPYSYSWTQTDGPAITLNNDDTPNPDFIAPGVTDTLQFTYTVTDAVGNSTVTQETVSVDSTPPIQVTLSGPATANSGSVASLNASVSGGVPPYSYHYLTTGAQPTIAATANPSVQLPVVNQSADLDLSVTLTVSDSGGRAAQATHVIRLQPQPHEALLCGDLANQIPCTDLDLVLAQTYLCPAGQPFAMNDVIKIGDRVLEFRRCVDRPTCENLWYAQTSNEPRCLNFDPGDGGGDITCHLCCYGDGCNTLTNPPANTLYRP